MGVRRQAEPESTAESAGALLRDGAAWLEGAGLPRARQDAEWLLAGLLGLPRWRLHLDPDRPVTTVVAKRFHELVQRRLCHEPVQYLLGWEEFRGLRLRITPTVLIPRPETELLVAWALELLPQLWAGGDGREAAGGAGAATPGCPPLVVDLGTGSGAIALALADACPGLTIYAVDRASGAVALARENAIALGLAARVQFLEGDLYDPLGSLAGAVDLIISNPPYIPSGALPGLPAEVRDYEPLEALDGGPEGVALLEKIIAGAPGFLRPGGWLLLEMGEGHSDRLSHLLKEAGFQKIQVRTDLGGVERMIGAKGGSP